MLKKTTQDRYSRTTKRIERERNKIEKARAQIGKQRYQTSTHKARNSLLPSISENQNTLGHHKSNEYRYGCPGPVRGDHRIDVGNP